MERRACRLLLVHTHVYFVFTYIYIIYNINNINIFYIFIYLYLFYIYIFILYLKTTNKHWTLQLSSATQLCPTLCDAMDCSTPGFPAHQLPELAQTHVHWVIDAIQPSQPLSSPSPPDFNLSKYQGLFQCVSSSHQVAKVLEFQLQHQSFQWTLRTDLL